MASIDYQLFHNEIQRRYELLTEGVHPYVEYEIKGDVMSLLFAYVPPQMEGQGIGKYLVEQVLEEIDRRGFKVVPYCSFIAAIIKRNERWHHMLA